MNQPLPPQPESIQIVQCQVCDVFTLLSNVGISVDGRLACEKHKVFPLDAPLYN